MLPFWVRLRLDRCICIPCYLKRCVLLGVSAFKEQLFPDGGIMKGRAGSQRQHHSFLVEG